VPLSTHTVVFDAGSVQVSTVGASFAGTVSSITIQAGYTGTLYLLRSLTTSATFQQLGGTMTLSTQTLTVGGDFIRTGPGPVGIGLFDYDLSDQSVAVRESANETIQGVLNAAGLGRFLKLTETKGAYCAHPLGGCRMADSADLGVVDHRCEAFGYEGLFCMDSSAIPTSLGVNPSLTISAVCERAASDLVNRAADLGLPAAPPGFAPGTPQEIVGDRVIAPDNDPPADSGTPVSLVPQPAAGPGPGGDGVAGTHHKRKKHKKHRRKHRHRVR
jgi:hypothetical protein